VSLTKSQALDLFHSDDLIGIGMEADAVRRQLYPAMAQGYYHLCVPTPVGWDFGFI